MVRFVQEYQMELKIFISYEITTNIKEHRFECKETILLKLPYMQCTIDTCHRKHDKMYSALGLDGTMKKGEGGLLKRTGGLDNP